MQRVKEAIKEKVGRKHHTGDEYGTTAGDVYGTDTYGTGAAGMEGPGATTGLAGSGVAGTEGVVERPVAVGTAEVPVVVTEQERMGGMEHHSHHRHHEGMAERLGEEVCGTKTFTEVEDRPVVKERVERVLEHRPVEKQYVVETKYVGEQAIPSATGATIIDSTERIVEAAEPGPKCPTGAGAMMDEAIGGRRNI